MATFKVLLHSSNRRKDGTYPVSLRIIKNMKAKYISLGLYSKKEEWDVIGERFRCDKRVCPNYKEFNARIVQLLARAQEVERHFEFDRIDWTLNQFEDAFLYKDKKGKFLDFALLCIKDMKETGHIGNAKVWEKVICNMKLFDKKLSTRYFQEIDISIINQEDKLKKSFDYTLPGNSETDKGQSLTVFSSESSLLVPKDTTNLNIEQQFMDEIIEKAKKSSPIGTEKTWGSKVYINAGIG